jgi:hypothetical protein
MDENADFKVMVKLTKEKITMKIKRDHGYFYMDIYVSSNVLEIHFEMISPGHTEYFSHIF